MEMSNYEQIIKLALERGFYFPSCEIYSDALAGFGNMVQLELTSKISLFSYGEERLLGEMDQSK